MAAGPRSALPTMPRGRLGEHLAGELVHAGGGGGAGGADDFFADGIDGADVVDEAVAEVDGEFFAAVEHVGDALVGGVAAGEELAGEEDDFAGLPGGGFFAGDGVEVDAAGAGDVVGEFGPVVERRRIEIDRAGAVEDDVAWRVAAQLGIMATGRLAAWVG